MIWKGHIWIESDSILKKFSFYEGVLHKYKWHMHVVYAVYKAEHCKLHKNDANAVLFDVEEKESCFWLGSVSENLIE